MKPSLRIWNVVIAALLVLGTALAVPGQAAVQAAGPNELFFSEYIEGSSNNKALEIYNGTGAAINLATNAYNVQMYFNGSSTAGLTINLTGTVADGDVYVLGQSSANATILAQADQTNSSGWFNGNDAVVLRKGSTVIDVIGQIGFNPGTEWGSGLLSTADNTLRRKASVSAGDTNGSDAFDPTEEWEGYATDIFDGLGAHVFGEQAPIVFSTSPANNASNVAVNSDLTITFSEPVNVTGDWFTLNCNITGSHSAAVNGGPITFTLNPDADFSNEICELTIVAANVTDLDSEDPPDAMVSDFITDFLAIDTATACSIENFTKVFEVQGTEELLAVPGLVFTRGVVIGDYEGTSPTLRGFYMQDQWGDGDPTTSDGIFVFNGNNNSVNNGDVVSVTGFAAEFQGQTQITAGTVVVCGTGTVEPTDVFFPVPNTTFLEQYEGMLVRLPQTMYVTEHFQLGRFGQVVLSADARLQQPTNVVAPGADANALQAANNLNKIILDDASQAQNPDPILFARGGLPLSASNTLRGGDTATDIIGVLNYTWAGNSASGNAYRVRPINALNGYVNFEAVNPRPAPPIDVGGTLEAGALNLLNYFNTFDGFPDRVDNCTFGVGGAPADCRGADTQAEFDRQWPKTVAAILGMNVDVLGIVEIENDGYGSNSAIQHLVDQLNAAAGAGTYAFIDVDAATGQVNALGTDAIKVGLIYKPAMVTPVGVTAALNSEAFVNGGDSAPRTRPALAQTFQQNANGARFTAVVNHFKSKGSACDAPDAFDGQGNCNLVRVNAAVELANWLASDPTLTSESDILILGDLNSYAMEDPITTLKNAGYTNLLDLFLGPTAYSYVFDGQWGYLDHALATGSLVPQVTGISGFHINADEPSVLDYNTDFKTPNLQNSLYAPDMFRVSDHDPVIVGLDLQNSPYPSDLGFVNGSGWVSAPEGSYLGNPAWSGKAQFAIDVKYHKDAVVPEGSFVLVLEKAGFEFFSTNVEWLTVSQDGQYAVFTGFGAANTIDGFRYIVWLQVGKPDYIRFQIWDGTQLVFDNGPLQRLSGNISIHQ
ncbi:MAG: ExeM/NucH family extracellular endonuclease [Bellilinea sp.]